MATYDGSIRINTKIDQAGFQKGISSIQNSVTRLTSSLKSLAVTVGAAFGVAKIIQFGKEAISLASDLNEVQNVVETAFGSMASQVDAWAENSIRQFGMSELAAKQMASTYMAMSVGSGLQGQGAADMAMKTAERAADIASFYNKTLEESDTMLKSIWTGETESLKQIGVVMTQTNLDAYALANGFGKTTSEMTQSEQIMLRYQYVMAQTGLAAGDFVKTQDSWANQTRILSEQWKQFLSIMGGALIQVLTPALQFLNGFMSVLTGWAQTFSSVVSALFGGGAQAAGNTQSALAGASASAGTLAGQTDEAAAAQDGLASSTAGANKELEKQMQNVSGLDELHTWSAAQSSASSAADGGGTGSGSSVSVPALSGELGSGVTVSPDLQQTIDTVTGWFQDVQTAAQPTMEALQSLWDELQRLGGFTWQALGDFYDEFLAPLGKWALGEGFPRFVNALTSGLAQVDYQGLLTSLEDLWKALEPFAENVGNGLLWFWETVLVPLGTWVLNEAVPSFLDLIATGVEAADGALDAAKEVLVWFWENFLQPLASWTGGVALGALQTLTGLLQTLGDWSSAHGAETQGILVGLGSAIAGWKLGSSVGTIKTFIDNLKLIQLIKTPQDFKDMVQILFPKLGDSLKKLDLSKLRAMTGMAAGIGLLAGSIYYLVTQWDNLSPAMKTAGIALGVLGAAITAVTIAHNLFNVSLLSSPITWVVLAIAALVAAFALLWENCEGFRNFWIGLWEGLKGAAEAVAQWFVSAWGAIGSFFSSLWQAVSGAAMTAWQAISSLWATVSGWFYNTIIQPLLGFFSGLWEGIQGVFESTKQWFSDVFGGAWEAIEQAWDGVGEWFGGIWEGIKEAFGHVIQWFSDTFGGAWEAVMGIFSAGGEIFDGIKEGIADVFTSVVNAIIDGINTVIAVPFNTINGILNWIRGIDILGFKPFEGLWGYNPLSVPQIPKLATGAVIPPNQEFLAILGDQKSGTNVEAPLDTIKQALREEMARNGNKGGVYHVSVQVGRKTFLQFVLDEAKMAQVRTGKNPFELA